MSTPNEPKQQSRRKFLKYTAGAVAVAVVGGVSYYYYGQSTAPMTSMTTSAASVTSATSAASVATSAAIKNPKYGGILKYAISGEPPGLDPQKSSLTVVAVTASNVYEALLDMDPDGKLIPQLAETWEMPDPLIHIYHLRDNVYFHNGRKMVADDVKYSFERVMDPATGCPYQSDTTTWDKVEALDDKTLRITLKQPQPALDAWLAGGGNGGLAFMVVNKETVEKYGDLQQNMIGTGPFKFVEFKKGDHITFERFENYWRKDPDTGDQLPYLDGLVGTFQPDTEVNLANLLTEQTMWTNVVNPNDWAKVSVNPDLTALNPKSLRFRALHFNTRKKPWNDARVRRAAAMGIDREEINKVVYFGMGPSAANPFAHLPPPYNNLPIPDLPQYDPEGAKKLLADAGYPNGFDDVLMGCPSPDERKSAEVVAAQLTKIGIRCKVDEPELARLLDLFFVKFDYSFCVCGGGGNVDPEVNMVDYGPLPDLVAGYNNPDVIAMYKQQSQEADPDKRAKIWGDILNQAWGKDVYAVWLTYVPVLYLYRKYVKGFQWGEDMRWRWTSVYLQK